MVNNAGASFRAKPEDISVNGWNTVVGINLNGVFLGCKWAGRQMMAQKAGGVDHQHLLDRRRLWLDDDVALRRLQGRRHHAHARARHGLGPPGRARELHRARARWRPRATWTCSKQAGRRKKTYDAVAARVGMGRWGKVEEIAYPCIFLASDASAFMTGETIVIDGGPAAREMEG